MPKQSGCLFAIFKLFSPAPKSAATNYPYRKNESLLTAAERSFFGVLNEAVVGRLLIFAKVRLTDLIATPSGIDGWQSHQNKIQSKHVDFVLCTRDTVAPLLCIELDDASHKRQKRIDRDAFLDGAPTAAGLPLLHVPAARAYNVANIKQQLDGLLSPPPTSKH